MTIAILTNDYPPHTRGGAGVIAETYVRELERRGHVVHVLYSVPEFTRRSALSRFGAHVRDLSSTASHVKQILAWKPDVLLTHNLTGCGFGTPRSVQRQGVRWVHMLHDVQLFEPSGRIVSGESHAWLRRVWRWGWSQARRSVFGVPDAVVSPTRWLRDEHLSRGWFRDTRIEVIPNPFSLVAQHPLSPWEAREVSVMFAGRVDPDKGIDVLFRAWQDMPDPRPRLEIVGEGDRIEWLRAQGDARCVVHGRRSTEEVRRQMGSCRVVVIPSLVLENQPTVALEAFAAGCAVVGSDVGGMAETLDGGGYLVPPGDSVALRDALSRALREGPRPERIQEVLRRHGVTEVGSVLEEVLMSKR